MTDAITDTRKSRGRPRIDATQIGLRLPPDQLARLDEWIAQQPEPRPSRPEAIRQLIEDGLRMPTTAALVADAVQTFRFISKAGFTGDAVFSGSTASKWLKENGRLIAETIPSKK